MGRWDPDAAGRFRAAAMELFGEIGYEQTTVAAIAERAGLTARTFFRYFTDKREVLFSGRARRGACGRLARQRHRRCAGRAGRVLQRRTAPVLAPAQHGDRCQRGAARARADQDGQAVGGARGRASRARCRRARREPGGRSGHRRFSGCVRTMGWRVRTPWLRRDRKRSARATEKTHGPLTHSLTSSELRWSGLRWGRAHEPARFDVDDRVAVSEIARRACVSTRRATRLQTAEIIHEKARMHAFNAVHLAIADGVSKAPPRADARPLGLLAVVCDALARTSRRC